MTKGVENLRLRAAIVKLRRSGMSFAAIGARLNLSPSYACRIMKKSAADEAERERIVTEL